MEDFLIIIIALLTFVYLYKRLFKSNGCSCSSKNCDNKK